MNFAEKTFNLRKEIIDRIKEIASKYGVTADCALDAYGYHINDEKGLISSTTIQGMDSVSIPATETLNTSRLLPSRNWRTLPTNLKHGTTITILKTNSHIT